MAIARSRTGAFLLQALILSAPIFLLTGCLPIDPAVGEAPQPRAVRVQTVAFEARPVTRSFAGTVRARTETDLAFRVGGKVVLRSVNVGDRITAGQHIALLDDTDLKLQVESAQAELDAARSSRAQTNADLARVLTLERKGWASGASSDRQQAAADEAAGRVKRAERNLDLARNQLSYVALAADGDGVVTATAIEPGQVVAAGQAAIRVARLGEKEAVIALPEMSISEVRNADATVELWSEPGRVYRAKLRELSPAADPATRTFAARFTIEDPSETVALGMTATLTLSQGAGPAVARLPLSAVYDDGSGPTVWVVGDDGSLISKPIDIAAYGAEDATIRSGLATGDKVVTLGVHKLDQGQRVRIVALQ
jgi:RND family efflux transporter MFP subunit